MIVTVKDCKRMLNASDTPPLLQALCKKVVSLSEALGRCNAERNEFFQALRHVEASASETRGRIARRAAENLEKETKPEN